MTSEAVTLRADYSPTESLSTSLYVTFKNENFNYPAATLAGSSPGTVLPLSGTGQGIRQDYSLSIGPDINYRPTHDLNIHFFYTYEQLYYDNIGNGQCSVAPITSLCTGTAGYFRNTGHQQHPHRRRERRLECQRKAEAASRIHAVLRHRDVR